MIEALIATARSLIAHCAEPRTRQESLRPYTVVGDAIPHR